MTQKIIIIGYRIAVFMAAGGIIISVFNKDLPGIGFGLVMFTMCYVELKSKTDK